MEKDTFFAVVCAEGAQSNLSGLLGVLGPPSNKLALACLTFPTQATMCVPLSLQPLPPSTMCPPIAAMPIQVLLMFHLHIPEHLRTYRTCLNDNTTSNKVPNTPPADA